MPEHTSFFSYLIAQFPALGENMHNFGHSLFGQPVTAHGAEPLVTSLFIMLLVLALAFGVSGKIAGRDKAILPEAKLTPRTFLEIWIGYWYGLMKDMMGPKRAKRYFPLIGSLSLFIVFSNFLGLVPGFNPPTSNMNITLGCAAVVFVMFNYYGLKENGLAYVKHLFGPWLGPLGIPINLLLFVIEVFSTCIRPLTLALRLMLNMAVDHMLVTITMSIIVLFLPVPVLVLSTLVCIVQVLVFCILTSIYIALATEHDEHEADAKSHGIGAAHAAGAGF
jgi:F-type H+-transporting ATPase subunit a